MSLAAYILLASIWILAVWVLSVVGAKLIKSLSSWPEYWLASIFVALGVPFVALALLGIGIQVPEAITIVPPLSSVPVFEEIRNNGSALRAVKVIALVVYFAGALFAAWRLLQGWMHLLRAKQSGGNKKLLGHDVVLTNNTVPLCAFGFFKPVILLPENLCEALFAGQQLETTPKIGRLLLDHEAAHIRYFDPFVMVCLLALKAIFWPHPAIYDLVKRWQCAAELRADDTALLGENLEIRKQYGQILVNVLRRSGVENSGRTLPCPSASLNLSNYRSAKMRVKNILNENGKLRKTDLRKSVRAKFQMGTMALTATLLGTYGLVAAASPTHVSDRDAQPSVRFPPIFPANCTANTGKYAASVVVKFDVDKAGNVENVVVTKSDNPCFNQASINSTAKWKYAPVLHKGKPRKRRGVQAMIKYMVTD